MSEWNLSVRLTGQGTGLARTLRSLSGDARTASRNVNALRRDISQLRASTRTPIRIRVGVDAGSLRADVAAALREARSGQGLAVDLRLGNAMQLRREVEAAVRWAAWGHRIQIPLGLADPMQLRRDVSAAVRWASMSQTIRVRVDADTTRLQVPLPSLPSGRGLGLGLGSLIPAATAVVPLIAGLTANLAPLVGVFAATGGAAAAFGIALGGQVGPLKEAADAEQAYQDAVRDHGAASREAAQAQLAYQRQLATMPPETQEAAVALSRLKTTFGDWSDDVAGFTMEPVTKGLAVVNKVIPALTPEVEAFSGSFDRLMTVAGGAVSTPGFDAFTDRVGDLTKVKVDDFTDQVIHLLRIVSQGDADAGAVGQIITYFRENGPEARAAVDAIGDAIATLAQGAAQAGPTMLTLVTAAAQLVAALPPSLVAVILQTATALKLLQLSGAGLAALAGGADRARAAIVRLAAVAAAAGGGLAGLRAAFLSLGTAAKASLVVAGIAAFALALHGLAELGQDAPPDIDKLTQSLHRLAASGKFSGELKKTFTDMDGLVDKVKKLRSEAEKANQTAFGFRIPGLDDAADWISGKINDISKGGESLKSLKGDFDALDKSMADLVKSGHGDVASENFAVISAALKEAGHDTKTINSLFSEYKSAVADVAFEQELAARSMGIFGDAATDVQAQLSAQKSAVDGLRESILALNQVNRDAYSAQINFEQAIDDLTDSFKKHGDTLNLDTEAGRRNADAMVQAAAAQDELIAAGIAAGESLESVAGKSDKLRATMLRLATDAFDGNKKKATEYVNTLLGVPSEVKTLITAEREQAIRGLADVQAAIEATPNAHTITVDTLNAAAIAALEAVGLKTRQLPDGRTEVTTANGQALGSIDAVAAALRKIDGTNATTTITTVRMTIFKSVQAAGGSNQAAKNMAETEARARGGLIPRYAAGGHIQAFPNGGYIQGPGSGTSDSILGLFASGAPAMVSNTEYVIRAASVRKYGVKTLDALNEGRLPLLGRLAEGGPTSRIPHLASGGFTYRPASTMSSVSDVASAYSDAHQPITKDEYNKKLRARANAVDALRAAEAKLRQVRKGRHTQAELAAAEARVAKARRSLATATEAAENAEARYRKRFSLSDWQKTLASTVKANAAYEANLKKIAERGGQDVIDQLRSMGEEGAALIAALAKASNKQFQDIVNNLKKIGPLAKATLADYTAQLNAANNANTEFQANLARLASMGYGDLASQLLAQGDDAAMAIAAAAVKDKGKAKAANEEAKQAKAQLTDEQQAALIQIIAAIKTKTTGIHAVADATGLGEDLIIEVANKAGIQIKQLLGGRAERFLADLAKANKGLAYENGGIRAGLYATQGGIIRFAEPATHGEAYIPLGPNKRGAATRVLGDVASRFGLGLTDGQAGRVVIIREQGPLVGETHFHVGDRQSDRDLARSIEARQGYQLRRLARGGVPARGTS